MKKIQDSIEIVSSIVGHFGSVSEQKVVDDLKDSTESYVHW